MKRSSCARKTDGPRVESYPYESVFLTRSTSIPSLPRPRAESSAAPALVGLLATTLIVACAAGSSREQSAVCVAGQSIACRGPGGCSGGQACNADGLSYGACLCGTSSDATTTTHETGAAPADARGTDRPSPDVGRPDSTYDAPMQGTKDSGREAAVDASGSKTPDANDTVPPDANDAAPQPIVLASGQDPCGIAVDVLSVAVTTLASASTVFWANFGTAANNYTDGTIMSVSALGGTPTTLATGQNYAEWLTADRDNVYWTTAYGGTVMKVPKTGGTATTLASGQNFPAGIAVDESNVYWATYLGGTVMKVPIAGGTPETVASGSWQPSLIAIDKVNIYWTNDDSSVVLMTPLVGSGTVSTVSPAESSPFGIAVNGFTVYWTDNTAMGSLNAVAVSGSSPTILASGEDYPFGVAVDSSNVYWATENAGTISKVVGGMPQVIASGQQAPYAVATDDGFVYWTNNGTEAASGTIMKLAK